MKIINLTLEESRQYSVLIGVDLFNLSRSDWLKWLNNNKICLVSNSLIQSIYAEKLENHLKSFGFEVHLMIIPDGEKYKNLQSAEVIFNHLMKKRFNRQSTIIALGGGVIGDLAGFVASSFMRGINLIQIPTSLLSQVDSSVGGKTGVNHPLGKNMIGSFYQPSVVLIDSNLLSTLQEREYVSGFAEVIKYALIMDAPFFDWLIKNQSALLKKEIKALNFAIYTSCNLKAKVVQSDEKEQAGRALLNLGHTFAHAIEASLGYGKWLHGEAVALGMIWASELSCQLGYISEIKVQKIKSLIASFNLPTKLEQQINLDIFINHLLHDKKFESDQIRLILLESIGKAYIEKKVNLATLKDFLIARIS